MSDTVITVENLSKKYTIHHQNGRHRDDRPAARPPGRCFGALALAAKGRKLERREW
jgi:hypothetical protein